MKKLLIIPLAFVLLAGGVKAEALSYVPGTMLSFENVTQNEATVRITLGADEYRTAAQNRYPIKVTYYPQIACAPAAPCMQAPQTQVFSYTGTMTDQSYLTMRLTNLRSGTQYNVSYGYEIPIVCVTTPCNPIQNSSQQQYSFTTLSNNVPLWTNTFPAFSNVGSNSALVTLVLGNDEIASAFQNGSSVRINYSYNVGQYEERTINGWTGLNPSVVLNNLRSNTQYTVSIGYEPSVACIAIYPSVCPTQQTVWKGTWSFTTTSNGVYPGGGMLTDRLVRGMKSQQVVVLQQILIKQGFLSGYADGSFGPRTHTAVVAFQRAHGLSADGVVGTNTRAVLNTYSY